jgi:hypothetical protein
VDAVGHVDLSSVKRSQSIYIGGSEGLILRHWQRGQEHHAAFQGESSMRRQVLGGKADGAAERNDLGLVHARTLVAALSHGQNGASASLSGRTYAATTVPWWKSSSQEP